LATLLGYVLMACNNAATLCTVSAAPYTSEMLLASVGIKPFSFPKSK